MLRSYVMSQMITSSTPEQEIIPEGYYATEGFSVKNYGDATTTLMCNALYESEGIVPTGEILHVYGDVSFRVSSLKIKESGSTIWISCGLTKK